MMRFSTCRLLALGWLGVSLNAAWAQDKQSSKNLTLQEAVTRAVAHNPSVDQAQAEMDAATERKRGAWTNVGPRVSAEYSQLYYGDKQQVDLGGGPIVLRDDV